MSDPDSSFASARSLRVMPVPRALRRASLGFGIALVLACAGCATAPSGTAPASTVPPVAPQAEPPPPPVNLQGFPLGYRQGFGDGCATARGSERKDAARFGNDGNYRVGWQDGIAQCKSK